MMNQQERRYIETVEKRVAHLAQRIAGSTKELSYDKAELAALSWMLQLVKGVLK